MFLGSAAKQEVVLTPIQGVAAISSVLDERKDSNTPILAVFVEGKDMLWNKPNTPQVRGQLAYMLSDLLC